MPLINGKLYTFSVVGRTDKLFHIEIAAMKAGLCKNNWDFTEECIEKSKETFRGMAILCAYKFGKIGDGHNFQVKKDPRTGDVERDFRGSDCERIVGYIPADSNIRYEMRNGEKWLIIPAVLFRFYNTQLVNDIVDKRRKRVSVEVETPDEWVEKLPDGKERIHQFDAVGITILGDNVTPAIMGAELRALSKSTTFKELSLRAASYIEGESQTDNQNKQGVNLRMFNRTELLKKLAEQFSGYNVLNFSDDGLTVALLKDGNLEMRSLEKNFECSVVPIIKAFAAFDTKPENEDTPKERTCEFEVNELLALCTKDLSEQNAAITKELEESKALAVDLQKQVDDFKTAEETRRKNEIVAALKTAREKESGDHPDIKVLETDYTAMLEKAEKGEFADVKACMSEFALKKMERIEAHKAATADNGKRINYATVTGTGESGATVNIQDMFNSLPTYEQ